MPKSRGSSGSGGGGRLQTAGIFLTFLVLAALVGSLAAGLAGGRGGEDAGAAPGRAPRAVPAERVRVEVLNASGIPGLAARGRTHLRDYGYDVVQIGNAPGFGADTSLVLDRVGRMDLARSVADAAGIPRVLARPDSNLYVDVTVVLGRDWSGDPAPDP
jgi:hypothetical protein